MTNKIVIYNIDSEGASKKEGEITTILNQPISGLLSCSWANPQYGKVIAVSTIQGKVFILKENNGIWETVFNLESSKFFPSILKFNPYFSDALILAVGYSDGKVAIIKYSHDRFETYSTQCHTFGVTGLNWLYNNDKTDVYLITSGNDGNISCWTLNKNCSLSNNSNLEKNSTSSIKGLDVVYTEDDGVNNIIAFDEDDEIYCWINKVNKSEFTSQKLDFNPDQKPSAINHITLSPCGKLISISYIEGVILYKQNQETKFWEIISTSNNDGQMISFN